MQRVSSSVQGSRPQHLLTRFSHLGDRLHLNGQQHTHDYPARGDRLYHHRSLRSYYNRDQDYLAYMDSL